MEMEIVLTTLHNGDDVARGREVAFPTAQWNQLRTPFPLHYVQRLEIVFGTILVYQYTNNMGIFMRIGLEFSQWDINTHHLQQEARFRNASTSTAT